MPNSEVHSTMLSFLMLSGRRKRQSTSRRERRRDSKALKGEGGVATRRNEVARVDCLFLRSDRRQASEIDGQMKENLCPRQRRAKKRKLLSRKMRVYVCKVW